ncbi:MAG: hypothetical protein DRR00_15955 [Candidatus Parabeggiatoa sp. nov. 3]|nr:MAG: hypothetical protein DRR00_15955 [Gammaproteobacteria bacterium]
MLKNSFFDLICLSQKLSDLQNANHGFFGFLKFFFTLDRKIDLDQGHAKSKVSQWVAAKLR